MTGPAAAPNGAVDAFGPPWVLQPDGVLFRRGARVVVIDPDDRVLLVRGHDVDQPERSWWFTIGGGIDPGEDARTAAVREAREEAGLRLRPADLVGPVFRRRAVFDFYARRCRQDEEIFLARVDGLDLATLDRSAWTAIERETIDELRWWDLDALEQVQIEVFPEGLPGLLRPVLAGWDGITRDLGTDDG
ncbi:NUDIX hydrolase [Cellulomonas bogoriensis]|uniref:NUDIX hydrolase n=1 Tax=Cellulomonas bogoriensis 69B4 = DSM 16987 TaxID=1386082 RepID=A0A0A0C0L8_9CELL|nr:NUDIX domain-containing protein [Cellulomonas bogoriensis]KGM13716.1 NUDIX hydrolase [Cellulomonas bogoriensis 69B4 = DSM 16987]